MRLHEYLGTQALAHGRSGVRRKRKNLLAREKLNVSQELQLLASLMRCAFIDSTT